MALQLSGNYLWELPQFFCESKASSTLSLAASRKMQRVITAALMVSFCWFDTESAALIGPDVMGGC